MDTGPENYILVIQSAAVTVALVLVVETTKQPMAAEVAEEEFNSYQPACLK